MKRSSDVNFHHTFTISLLKAEILILASLPPYEWIHQLQLQQTLRDARDVDVEELGFLLHGLWRIGLLLERPHILQSEYMLSDRGLQLRNQVAQRHARLRIRQISPEIPE